MSETTAATFQQTDAAASPSALKLFAVIVIYKMLPAACPSLNTLVETARACSSQCRLHIRIVDNTPGGQDPGLLPKGSEYCASPDNPGLSKAYNEAWQAAERENYGWLLTLDQDTHLPATFLASLERVVRQYDAMKDVAAIVPRMVDRGRPVSPLRFAGGFLPLVVPAKASGRLNRHALALNSASLLRVSALRDVDGYDEAFPLHNSDTSLYQRLDKAGRRVVLAEKIVVQHELAIMDRSNRMSGERYRSMLADERAFWDLHMGFLGRFERTLRLIGRVAKDMLRGKRGNFTAITVKEIQIRLLTRRKDRVARWKVEPQQWKT